MAKTWREAAQQPVQNPLPELRVLNSNQAALAATQAQIEAGLAKIGNTDTQLAALAATQADATRELAAAQTALARETANLVASLRQTFQQGLGEAASQSHADTLKLQTQVAEAATNLAASLHQTFQQGFAEAAGQSRADTLKLQTQVAEVAASQHALLDRLSGSTNAPNLALALPGVRTKTVGNSILLTFDDGLFVHGTYFKPDAKSRLRAVARALARVSTPLRTEVIGCADDDRAFRSWTARFEETLALDRATAVVNYFIELGLFAPDRLAALSGGATIRPFPSDTAENRARNRTAVLRISTGENSIQGYIEPAP